ncbi:caspase domain-containing protein [uncultured Nostoc sp.]|uniref:caspase family protein n=1 Tax=uncultured Nostoc sp. TaxID=340711 RepID=UPI0035CAF787
MSKYEFQRNFTVVIGINNYLNGIPELETPVADAQKLAKILQENYQYEVQILLNEKATLEKLNSLLEDFKQKTLRLLEKTVQLEENDRLIFYFAGHGIVPADGLEKTDNLGGYLVPQNARGDILLQKQIEINTILLPMQTLHDALAELPCRHLLIIVDCCFALLGHFGRVSIEKL